MKTFSNSKFILAWSLPIALLVIIASLFGLFDPAIYAKETANWAMQAKGQDIGNLIAVVMLLISGLLFSRGSYRSGLVWLGTLLYLVYAYIVYAVAVHLNALFLVYVAVLGLSSYAIVFTINGLRTYGLKPPRTSILRLAGYTLGAIGVLFTLLWLSELIPALLAGEVPRTITEAGLWVNPIHVIDLAIVLPAFIITSFLTIKSRRDGLFFMGSWLVFAALMATSIVAAMILTGISDGFQTVLPPLVMVALVMIASSYAAWRYLRHTT